LTRSVSFNIENDGALSEANARFYFQQLISAVSFCGKQHIAHRDLKLENMLLTEDEKLKIADFGLSGLFNFDSNQISMLHTTCGTINYLAPEVFSNLGYDGHLADTWSCGVILYVFLTGKLPFEDDYISKLIEKIVSARYEAPKNVSKSAVDLLS
jgi:serine/threonine protein kinase